MAYRARLLWLSSLLSVACGDDAPPAGGSTSIPATESSGTVSGSTASVSTTPGDGSSSGATASGLNVFVREPSRAAVEEFVRLMPATDITVEVSSDPWLDAQAAEGVSFAVELEDSCADCYRLSSEAGAHRVQGGNLLGAQIGLARAFEAFGVRFFAPHSTYIPDSWNAEVRFDAQLQEPEIAERGIQLHTLHTVEGLYAFWMPSEEHFEEAKVIADWYVKHGANLLQWVGVENILYDDQTYDAWEAHTASVNQYLHDRGLRAGVNIQLYGSANLQNAFDLLDTNDLDLVGQEAAMTERLDLLLGSTAFDHVTISFGEFSGADPEPFIESTDLVWQVVDTVAPGTTMGSKIHVGNYEDLFVDYEGESYLFYFLAQFADPNIVPWVHTVMYYNLYEDAGGAYAHEEFDLHRNMLLDRLDAGEDVAYFPETAYWVAFDNSVPTYLPLYMKSRFIDLEETRLRAAAPLQRHTTFCSGFEWGYWQNDYATLRMNYELPEQWGDPVNEMFAPFGSGGSELATVIVEAGERQHQALIVDRLAAYMAGRDVIIDLAATGGTIAQPDRVSFADIEAMTPSERQGFVDAVIDPLDALADDFESLADRAEAIEGAEAMETWHQEVTDGLRVDALRARFSAAVHRAIVDDADGRDDTALVAAGETFASAQSVVAARHAALLHPDGARLTASSDQNPTIYGYGYLGMADTLCYWERELIAAQNLVTGSEAVVPPCFTLGG